VLLPFFLDKIGNYWIQR